LFPLRVANPAVNAALARLVEACLNEDPARRPASAAELNHSLSRELRLVRRCERWALTHKRTVWLAAAIALGSAAAVPAYVATRPPPHVAALAAIDEGWAAYRSGDYALAAGRFSRSAELAGGDSGQTATLAAALFGRGRSRQRSGEFEKATDDFLRASELSPSDGRTFAAAAFCCVRQGLDRTEGASSALPLPALVSKAVSLCDAAERAGFRSAEMRYNLAQQHLLLGRTEPAHAILKELCAERCRLAEVYYLLAVEELAASHNERRPPDPSWCERALELGSQQAEVQFAAACTAACRANYGDTSRHRDAALAHWQRAVERGMDAARFTDLQIYHGALVEPASTDSSASRRRGTSAPSARWPSLLDPLAQDDGPLTAR
jgi:tetratricopeptide (TPR) repeat protein